MPAPITMVATTDIQTMMNPGPERRMFLPGFDAEFVDFPHYIIRITERIWHDREVELCLKWYAPDCLIHTLAGPIRGAQTVVDNTWATLSAFPDRRLDGDNVIWSDDGDGTFLSSHLITSKMTNRGDSDFGPATGRRVLVRTIADCLWRSSSATIPTKWRCGMQGGIATPDILSSMSWNRIGSRCRKRPGSNPSRKQARLLLACSAATGGRRWTPQPPVTSRTFA